MLAKARLMRSLLVFTLILASILILLEVGYKYFIPKDIYSWDQRFMLFSEIKGGSVFKNIGSIFTYQPNKKIFSETYYYYAENKWIKEYQYEFLTNNYGLVQKKDIEPEKPSLLLIGDSYTEGQGASPWFETLNDNLGSKLQLINGGLLGTGFIQWDLLLEYFYSKSIRLDYMVVIFISDDYGRKVWNFPQASLACISDYSVCKGFENFYGIPPPQDVKSFLNKLHTFRIEHPTATEVGIKKYFNEYLPASYALFQLFSENSKLSEDDNVSTIKKSDQVIKSLINKYQKNVLFIHLPQKDETKYNRINPYGELARSTIADQGGNLVDGFKACGLTNADYYPNDGHPNQQGYAKIEECIRKSINDRQQLN
jgi:lysophospholipase L1-like esterase